jgi:hypothetical protein
MNTDLNGAAKIRITTAAAAIAAAAALAPAAVAYASPAAPAPQALGTLAFDPTPPCYSTIAAECTVVGGFTVTFTPFTLFVVDSNNDTSNPTVWLGSPANPGYTPLTFAGINFFFQFPDATPGSYEFCVGGSGIHHASYTTTVGFSELC